MRFQVDRLLAALVNLGVADAKHLEKRSPIDEELGGRDRSSFLAVRPALNSKQFRQVEWSSNNRTRAPNLLTGAIAAPPRL
jgi:hypothetical protein